jgi:hypothetical protein
MSTAIDWNFARLFQDYLVDAVNEFDCPEVEQGEDTVTH